MPYAAASFGDCMTQTLGAVVASSTGTQITSNATANTKGNWTSLGQASRAYEFIHASIGAAGATADFVFDVGLSANGSTGWYSIAENLRLSSLKAANDLFLAYSIPIRVPDGFFVGVRSASSVGGQNFRSLVTLATSTPLSAGTFSECKALYIPGTSRGITIDPGATANTKGAWTNITTIAADETIDAIMLGIGPNNDVARTANGQGLLDIGVGTTGNQYVVIENILWGFSTTTDFPFPNVIGPFPVSIPPGTDIWARAQSTNNAAGDRTIDLAIWGLIA